MPIEGKIMELQLYLNNFMWKIIWIAITYPELILLFLAIFTLVLGILKKEKYFKVLKIISYGMVASLTCLFLAKKIETPSWIETFFVKDGIATLSQYIIFCFVVPWIFPFEGSKRYGGVNRFEYTPLVLFSILGMFLMVSATNLMSLYLGIELQSLPLYALVGLRQGDRNTCEGALKYFILGALASCVLLYGCALVYGACGSVSYESIIAIVQTSHTPLFFIVGMVLIVCGMFFKLSAAPFHMWSPDVYEASSGLQVAVLSTGSKIAAFGALSRLLYGPFYLEHEIIEPLLISVSILSLGIGAFGALWQQNIKRLIAYSSIGHVGFMGLSFLIKGQGLSYLFFYLITYGIGISAFFLCLNYLHKNEKELTSLSELKGLFKTQPQVALGLSVALFSLAGIPPLAGFWGKLYILLGLVDQGYAPLAIFAVLISVISAFYYLKIIKYIYFEEAEEVIQFSKGRGYMFASMLLVAVVVLQSWGLHLVEYSLKGLNGVT
jgi:NADH-quinone oxidoreductase subunit N